MIGIPVPGLILGEQILYYHQPDEDLKREDIIPDLRVPPPVQARERQLQRCVDEAAQS